MTGFIAVLATGILSLFSQRVQTSLVSFDYSFKVAADLPLTGKGSVEFEGESFHMKGNGLELWSDGESRWTFDSSSMELYIETVDPSCVDYISNPVALLRDASTAFTQTGEKSTVFAGVKAVCVSLVPVDRKTGLGSVSIYFNSENIPVGASVTVSDGTVTTFTFSSFAFKKPEGKKFACDEKSLGGDVLVTDLR